MSDEFVNLPNMPGYVTIKEAAKMLGLAYKTVHEYISEGRIPAVRAGNVIMISLEDLKKFKRNISGRPRTSIPTWRISPEDNTLLVTSIQVDIRQGQQARLNQRLEEIRRSGQHNFPGTVARYILASETAPTQVTVILIWRSSVMPAESECEQAMEAFRQSLADVLDWSTAHYSYDKVYMHT